MPWLTNSSRPRAPRAGSHKSGAAREAWVLGRPAEARRFASFSLPYSPGRVLGAEARATIVNFATNGWRFSRGRFWRPGCASSQGDRSDPAAATAS